MTKLHAHVTTIGRLIMIAIAMVAFFAILYGIIWAVEHHSDEVILFAAAVMGLGGLIIVYKEIYQGVVEEDMRARAVAAQVLDRANERAGYDDACSHPNAEYDSSGAWCPRCGASGTIPGGG